MDSDLPQQYMLQQQMSRPVSGEELEAMGKKASASWRSGEFKTLSEAVVGAVKQGQLSPEQVRRVVEFTNQDAYLQEFKKEGRHKVVHFDHGPADPSEVLKDLNDGGGGTVFDRGQLDYSRAPDLGGQFQGMFDGFMGKAAAERCPHGHVLSANQGCRTCGYGTEKTASTEAPTPNLYEDVLLDWFHVDQEKVADHDPTRELRNCWYELGAARQSLSGQLDGLELDYHQQKTAMWEAVRDVVRDGASLADVVEAWGSGQPEPYEVKIAFEAMAPELKRELGSLDQVGVSLTKRAALGRQVDETHPVVETFRGFTEVLHKLANLRSLQTDIDEAYRSTEALMKEAVGGLVGKAWRGLGHAGEAAGEAVAPIAEALTGANPETVKNVARKTVQYGGAGAGLLAANAAQQEVTDRPVVRSGVGAAKSLVPGTQEYNARRYRIMGGGMY